MISSITAECKVEECDRCFIFECKLSLLIKAEVILYFLIVNPTISFVFKNKLVTHLNRSKVYICLGFFMVASICCTGKI